MLLEDHLQGRKGMHRNKQQREEDIRRKGGTNNHDWYRGKMRYTSTFVYH